MCVSNTPIALDQQDLPANRGLTVVFSVHKYNTYIIHREHGVNLEKIKILRVHDNIRVVVIIYLYGIYITTYRSYSIDGGGGARTVEFQVQ